MSKKSKKPDNQICANKKARHEYFIEETFEAGLSLQGWEVKAIRAGKMTITEAYIIFRNNEAFLFGAHIQPLLSSSTHVSPDSIRTRKLLLNRREIENSWVRSIKRLCVRTVILLLEKLFGEMPNCACRR